MAIEVRQLSTKRSDLSRFIKFGIDLYDGNPYFVPPLIWDEIGTLSPAKNPAFEFCQSAYFMAYRDGKPVGRIAGIINSVVNERTATKAMRFGFCDFIDDDEVVDALFSTVEKWGKSKGMNVITGPLGFTDMDREGLLIEGFDQVSTMATNYNYPYYQKQLERMGFTKEVDWVEFRVKVPEQTPEKMERISNIVKMRTGVHVGKFKSIKEVADKYGEAIFELINLAYDKLHGYSPLSPRQIQHYINMYLPIVRLSQTSLLLDKDEKLVGVGLVMPSLSQALIKSRGRLFPTGWYHLLKALKGHNDVVDLLLVAIHPDYQGKGVNALLFSHLVPEFIKSRYLYAESNPELEMNGRMQSQWEYFDYNQNKRRRLYHKDM